MPFIQARVKFTNAAGRVVTGSSSNLNVVLPAPPTGNLGNWDYSEFVLELNSGHSGQEILVYFENSVTGNYALFSDFRITDPNSIVTKAAIAPKTGTNAGASLKSNGKAGMLALRCVGSYDTIHVWTWVGGTAVIKRIHSFGNLVKHVKLPITGYNYDAPDNILPNIKSVQFGLPTVTSKFNSQRITSWDVSNLTSMVNMFLNCVDFNQDLSGWCVPQFSSEPQGFSTNAPLTQANKPVWGTCHVAPIISADVTMYYNERSMQGDNFRIYSAGFDPVGPMKIDGVVYNDLTDILVLRERLNVKTAGPLFNLFSKYSKVSAKATLANGAVVNVSWSYQTTSGGGRLYNYDGSPNIGNFHNRIKPYHGQPAKLTLKLSN